MKFFTMAWWGVPPMEGPVSADRTRPFEEYAVYLATFVDRLPAGLVTLAQMVPLHDAKLRHLRFSPDTRELRIELENFDVRHMARRRFFLRYDDVSALESFADPAVSLAGPGGYGDLGYDELDITSDGKGVHRLLFSTGIELHIVCGDAAAWWEGEDA